MSFARSPDMYSVGDSCCPTAQEVVQESMLVCKQHANHELACWFVCKAFGVAKVTVGKRLISGHIPMLCSVALIQTKHSSPACTILVHSQS